VSSIPIGNQIALNANALSLLDRQLTAIFPTSSGQQPAASAGDPGVSTSATAAATDQTSQFRQLLDSMASADGAKIAKMRDAVVIGVAATVATSAVIAGSPLLLAAGAGVVAASEIGLSMSLLLAASGVTAKYLKAAVDGGDANAVEEAADFATEILDPGKSALMNSLFNSFADESLPIAQTAELLNTALDSANEFFNKRTGADNKSDAQRVAENASAIRNNLPKPTLSAAGFVEVKVPIGSSDLVTKTLTLSNTGQGASNYSVSLSPALEEAGLSVSPSGGQLAANSQTNLSLSIDPRDFDQAATINGTITITDPNATNPTITVHVTIRVEAPKLVVTPTSAQELDVVQDEFATVEVTVTNGGGDGTILYYEIKPEDQARITVDGARSGTLAKSDPGDTFTIKVDTRGTAMDPWKPGDPPRTYHVLFTNSANPNDKVNFAFTVRTVSDPIVGTYTGNYSGQGWVTDDLTLERRSESFSGTVTLEITLTAPIGVGYLYLEGRLTVTGIGGTASDRIDGNLYHPQSKSISVGFNLNGRITRLDGVLNDGTITGELDANLKAGGYIYSIVTPITLRKT
jgi:hypothetical protein